ncbi:MAG: c-type cytochrome [Deltaproteobacteria bacterium]|nr:c-type cytochrome [Deltaproteobacteria bacterium]NIS77910.1 c-type cytochrome [Deltaproteobacteria bacterium]
MRNRRFRHITPVIFSLALCFLLVVSGCGEGTKKAPEKAKPEAVKKRVTKIDQVRVRRYFLVSDLFSGRKIFEEKHCSQCHAIFEKEEKAGPTLDTSEFRGSFLDIFSTLWNHAPQMAVHMRKEGLPRPDFSTPELNQLVSFLYMLPYLSEPGDPAKGEKILMEKLCFNCHFRGSAGKRGGVSLDPLGAYKSQIILIQRMWNHGPMMISQMISTGTPVPKFSGKDMANLFAALTEGERGEKKIFLGIGDANRGRTLFAEKKCISCHAVFGQGGKQGPDLGETVSQAGVAELTALLWNHSGEMQEKFREKNLSWPYFSETEMGDLIVYLYSLNYIDKPGDPSKGAKILEQKGCADCHFETEEDKKTFLRQVRPDNSIQFSSYLWNHIPNMEANMVSQAVTWPELTGQELRDILAFLQSQ